MSPIEVNTKTVVFTVIGGLALMFVVYSMSYKKQKSARLNQSLNWKSEPFVDIPEHVAGKAKDVKIQEEHVKLSVDGSVGPSSTLLNSWKSEKFVDIPSEVLEKGRDVKIEEEHFTITVNGVVCFSS